MNDNISAIGNSPMTSLLTFSDGIYQHNGTGAPTVICEYLRYNTKLYLQCMERHLNCKPFFNSADVLFLVGSIRG